jgi:hypothetical protein
MSGPVTTSLNCDDVMESLGAYALGILEPEEARDIQRHLATCPACSAELARMESVVESLGSAPLAVAPPEALRQRILAEAIAQPTQDLPAPSGPVLVKGSSRLVIPRWSIWPAAAAAILLLAAVATLSVLLSRANDKIDTAESTQRQLANYLSAGGQAIKLSAHTESIGGTYAGHGSVVTAPNMPPILVVSGCPPSSQDRQYRVWLSKSGDRTGVGELTVDSKGNGWLKLDSTESLDNYDEVGVTMIVANNQRQDWLTGNLNQTSSA